MNLLSISVGMKFVVYRCATFALVVRVLQEVVVIRLLTNKTLQWQRCVAMFEREEVMAQAGETAQELAAIALSKVKELTQCGGDQELLISTCVIRCSKLPCQPSSRSQERCKRLTPCASTQKTCLVHSKARKTDFFKFFHMFLESNFPI